MTKKTNDGIKKTSSIGVERISKEDDLINVLSDTINKSVENKPSYFLNQEGPVNIKDWVSSGAVPLDIIMSNTKEGGFPVGRITEITGLESSGKSLLAAHALANTQKKGGIAVYIDTEQAVSRDFLTAIGVDIKKLVYANIEKIEDVFRVIEEIIEKVRKDSSDRLITIVTDSIAATTTSRELNSDYQKDGYSTEKAIIIGKALRKITNLIAKERICLIFTNQLRERMNVLGDPYTTPGGRALAFHASIRLRLKMVGRINVNNQSAIGIQTRVETIKNKIAPQFQKTTLHIYFDRGIDDDKNWLFVLSDMGVIKQKSAWYTFINETTGEEIKFQKNDFREKVLNDKENYEYLYEILVNNLIKHYKINSKEISDTDTVIVKSEK